MNTLDYIVKKFNIEVGSQYFIDIPEMVGSVDLAKLFGELGFRKGVEIGTDEGIFAEVLCKTIPNVLLTCVDPWKAQAYLPGEQPEGSEPQSYFDNRYAETTAKLQNYNVSFFKETSMKAKEYFLNDSVDFVYIDGNHDFLNVTQDIHYWYKKVKPGGIISGHDYVNYPFRKYNHVKKAVQAYAKAYHLLPVFAVKQDKHGLRRDRYRSWFIVKGDNI